MIDPLSHNPLEGALVRLRRTRAFLLDMDGTLYVGERAVPGAREWVAALRDRGAPYVMLTNNSSQSDERYLAKLARLGIDAGPRGVLTSGEATARHLLATTALRRPYVVGTPALEAHLAALGLDVNPADPDCVIVGFDTTFTYDKLTRAYRLLARGLPYYATHPDYTCIVEDGLIPDIRAILGALREMTGRWPEIIGKPERPIVDIALARLGATADETAMVGDQLDTDMTMARRAGLLGVLVMTGETTAEKLAAWPEKPDLIVSSVDELRKLWTA